MISTVPSLLVGNPKVPALKMREQLLHEGANPAALTPAEFAAFVRQDIERWAPVVRRSGAKPD